jgi:hypothetical protein
MNIHIDTYINVYIYVSSESPNMEERFKALEGSSEVKDELTVNHYPPPSNSFPPNLTLPPYMIVLTWKRDSRP